MPPTDANKTFGADEEEQKTSIQRKPSTTSSGGNPVLFICFISKQTS
jgi:hypothetical protein